MWQPLTSLFPNQVVTAANALPTLSLNTGYFESRYLGLLESKTLHVVKRYTVLETHGNSGLEKEWKISGVL